MKMKYRILIVLAIVVIAIIYYLYPCLMLSFKNIPDYDSLTSDVREVLFLYGMGICNSCSTGEFINSLEVTENILFVVPDNYSDNDVKNFKDAFNIKGLIIRGGEDTLDFIKNIASCNRMGEWRNNYYVTLKENKKFETIKQI